MIECIRVAKVGGSTVHGLLDPGRTYCGKHTDRLKVTERLQLDTLPSLDGCRSCGRVIDGWVRPLSSRLEPTGRWTLPPSEGSLRKTGPLYHGTTIRRGRRQ